MEFSDCLCLRTEYSISRLSEFNIRSLMVLLLLSHLSFTNFERESFADHDFVRNSSYLPYEIIRKGGTVGRKLFRDVFFYALQVFWEDIYESSSIVRRSLSTCRKTSFASNSICLVARMHSVPIWRVKNAWYSMEFLDCFYIRAEYSVSRLSEFNLWRLMVLLWVAKLASCVSGRDNLISPASASHRWRDYFGTRSKWRSEWVAAVNFHKLSRVLEHALLEDKPWTKTFMSDSHHMKINQGFIIKSSRSKENCEVIYNICLKLSILKCTLYYMHYVTTIV
jgi:hypothetical protein